MAIMGLNPDGPDFSIETVALGRIDALPLTVGRMMKLEMIEEKIPAEFINALIAVIGRKSDGTQLVDDDPTRLSDAERDEFATLFLEHNQYLFREKVQEERQDEDGRTVVSYREGDVRHPQEDGESTSVYLSRLFKIQQAEQREQMRQLIKPFDEVIQAHRSLFTPSFLETFKKSQSATAQLGEMIKRMRFDMLDESSIATPTAALAHSNSKIERTEICIPKLSAIHNPAHDTNARLSEVVNRLDSMEGLALQMAETVKGVSDSASQFLVAFGAASDKADRTSRRAIGIAAAAIVVAVVSVLAQVGYSEWRSARDQMSAAAAIDEISSRIEAVAEVQRESMSQIGPELTNGNSLVKDSFDQLSIAIQGLAESLRRQDQSPAETQESSGVGTTR